MFECGVSQHVIKNAVWSSVCFERRFVKNDVQIKSRHTRLRSNDNDNDDGTDDVEKEQLSFAYSNYLIRIQIVAFRLTFDKQKWIFFF